MFRSIKCSLDDNSTNSIAQSQTFAQGTNLNLNGLLFADRADNKAVLNIRGFSYFVTLTSSFNLSAITFTIVGYQNGARVTSTINGPTINATVADYTTLYDSVISVTPNNNFNGATLVVGHASYAAGQTYTYYSTPFLIDSTLNKNINSAISISTQPVTASNGVFGYNYNIYVTLEDIVNNGKSIPSMINNELIYAPDDIIQPVVALNPFIWITEPFRYVVIACTPKAGNTAFPGTILRFSQEE